MCFAGGEGKNKTRSHLPSVLCICPSILNMQFLTVFQMDPSLEKHREQLVIEVGRKLDKARMIRFEERTGFFSSTDLGRIASHYYIKYNTIEVMFPIIWYIMKQKHGIIFNNLVIFL